MTHRRLSTLALVSFAAALAVPGAHAFAPDASSRSLEFQLPHERIPAVYTTRSAEAVGMARSAGLGPSWQIQTSRRTGHVHAAWGGDVQLASSVTGEAQAEALSRSFLLTYPDLLGVREDNLQLRNVRFARGKYAVHFRQEILGVPVRDATAWVLLDESGTVAAFGSDFYPEYGEIPDHPAFPGDAAVTAAANALGATPLPDRPVNVREVLVPAASGELLELTPAYEVTFETETPFGKWESVVHGRTGEVLARRNLFFPINVVGDADGDVQNQEPSLSYCDGSGTEPFAHMEISVSGGGTGVTDASGNFDIAHGGASPVDVTATFDGPYIEVTRFTGLGADASVTEAVTPGTPATISFDTGNARRDEMDTFFHGNRVRDFMLSLDPTFTQLDIPVLTTVGRTDGFCPGNAWWNIGGGNMNFCAPGNSGGTDYANTGELANVIYHEYGHGVTEMVYSRNGQGQPVSDLHEGNSDVLANFLDRNSDIGIGFFLDVCGPGTGIRDANNSLQWPGDNDGGHGGGRIIAGFHWDAWQSLLASESQATADAIAWDTWHYARDMGTPTDQPSQVLWTFLMDDDDANLANGTPNYGHFALAALSHGFTPPAITEGVLITHAPLAHTTDGSGREVVATIVSTEAALDPSELKLHYNLNGGPEQVIVMSATGGADEYSATIPATGQHAEVVYWITAEDMLANAQTDPLLAPTFVHEFDVAAVYDDLEGDTSGWSTVDNASTGEWEVADPISTGAVPDDDATADPGVLAWITGQCSGPNCGTCSLGCNDIDAGTVELFSPVWDVSSFAEVTLKYERFYNNNTGADPNNDTFIVEVSNDGGSNWTEIENTMASTGNWTTMSVDIDAMFGTPGQVQLHFVASDLNAGSIVEAGVDDVRILAANSGGAVAADLPAAAAPLALSLEQNQPNPFRPETTIRFALPEAGDARLAVYDVTGRAVQELTSGPRPAGRHTVTWNGKDGDGNRVSAGVYFYRLTAGGEVLTRKMTVLK
ncbi:MAG TPA: FlgD immunoglobulin-like domain containing protein [bacterium]|nr:FlgD immunoglobulin-like domain containing protein [bacterium]